MRRGSTSCSMASLLILALRFLPNGLAGLLSRKPRAPQRETADA